MKLWEKLIKDRLKKPVVVDTNIGEYASPIELAENESGLKYTNYAYLVDFMNDKSPDHSVLKAAQLGFTTGAIYVVLHRLISGTKVLYLLPDATASREFSAGKLNLLIYQSKTLEDICDVDNVRQKIVGGTTLYLRGANSRKQLKEISVGLLVLDEYDEMKDAMVELAYERLSGHENKQVIRMSTPSLPGVGIHKVWKESDQYTFMVSCYHCNKLQGLTMPANVNLEGGFYFCSHCKKAWDDEGRMAMNRGGKYVLTKKGNGKVCRYVNQLYSPTITMKEFCLKAIEAEGNEAKTQELYNSKLAKPYEAKGSRLTYEVIDKAKGHYNGGGFMVAGIDVSQASEHYCVLALSTEYGIVVKKVCRVTWDSIGTLMADNAVKCLVIDAQPERAKALEILNALPIQGYRCLYPNQKEQIKVDDANRYVKVSRTDLIDIVMSRFRQNTIMLDCSKNLRELSDHIHNTVRSYRQVKGEWQAYYTEEGDDHYLHALVYAEVASRVTVKSAGAYESIGGTFI